MTDIDNIFHDFDIELTRVSNLLQTSFEKKTEEYEEKIKNILNIFPLWNQIKDTPYISFLIKKVIIPICLIYYYLLSNRSLRNLDILFFSLLVNIIVIIYIVKYIDSYFDIKLTCIFI